MSYRPDPIDDSAVVLTPDLLDLTERLSENVHDRWSETRMAQGWRLGETRDDTHKLHPCLIPYGQLSEDEKELDRVTVLATLKAVLALGFRIVPPERQPE